MHDQRKTMLRDILKALHALEATYPKQFNVRLGASRHFVDRIYDRADTNPFSLMLRVIEAINENICLVIYYTHLDSYLPERGEIAFDDYVIRGNVINGRYVMQTIFRPGID